MRIAFYAPLNSPLGEHPSGDRLMARQIMAVLRSLGHVVELASELRCWLRQPDDLPAREAEAAAEMSAINQRHVGNGPDLWFTYHLYYRAPDLIGPAYCGQHGIPYIVAEASYAPRRADGPWAQAHAIATAALRQAQVIFAMTKRDALGVALCPGLNSPVIPLPPFLMEDGWEQKTVQQSRREPRTPVRLVTVAMMREGDKTASYRLLARALECLADTPWHLAVIGDGPARPAVQQAFAGFAGGRITWLGQLHPQAIRAHLDASDIFVWPGQGEAYGMVYLEAQSRGLPVVAMDSAGVSSVVRDQVSGLLAPEGDVPGFAERLGRLIGDHGLRRELGLQAQEMVGRLHSEREARRTLGEGLQVAMSAMTKERTLVGR